MGNGGITLGVLRPSINSGQASPKPPYFNQLPERLKKNRNKLSIDPSDRKTQELLENQFTKSMSILEPLKARIKATDELIDEIVYRLYGLAEEEIKIIEGKV